VWRLRAPSPTSRSSSWPTSRTGELDSSTAREILGLFQSIVKEEKVTMLMASHDGLVDEYVDMILQLKDGRSGTKEAGCKKARKQEAIPCFLLLAS
jgi:ABC-type lipoprotein export system ATPase subunit